MLHKYMAYMIRCVYIYNMYIYIYIRTRTDMFGVEGLEKLHIYIYLSIQIHVYMHIDVCTLQVHMLFFPCSGRVGGRIENLEL